MIEWQFASWRTFGGGILLAGKFFEGDVERIVTLATASVDGARDDGSERAISLELPGVLYGEFIFCQRSGFVGGDRSDHTNRLNSTHLMNEGFFGCHTTHTEHEHDRNRDRQTLGNGTHRQCHHKSQTLEHIHAAHQ